MKAAVGCLLALLVAVASATSTIHWDEGVVHTFSLQSLVSSSGSSTTAPSESTKYYIIGTAAFTCVWVDDARSQYGIRLDLLNVGFYDESMVKMEVGDDPKALFEQSPVFFSQEADGRISSYTAAAIDSAWITVFKKSVVSAMQTQVVPDGVNALTVSLREAIGSHTMRFTLTGPNTISGSFSEKDFKTFPHDATMQGTVQQKIGAEGIVVQSKLQHDVVFTKHAAVSFKSDDPDYSPSEETISSSGYVALTLTDSRAAPASIARAKHPFRGGLNGYVTVTLAASVDELQDATRQTEATNLLSAMQPFVDDLLTNPQAKGADALFESAHKLVSFAWKHSDLLNSLTAMLKVRVPANPDLVNFVLSAATSPEQPMSSKSVTPAKLEKLSDDPSYPHAKQYEWQKDLGGKDVCLKLDAGYFAGTNFDCTHEDLNYKLNAHGSADATVFGYTKTVFQADATYAVIAGGTVQNRLFVKLWDTVLKDIPLIPKDIPPCPPETVQKIWAASPGAHYSYTLMVGPVPITFSVGVTLQLELDWGYLVCIQDLKAQVDLQPRATLVASASAEVKLLIARGGVEIMGSINQKVIPRAWINGNLCSFGIDVTRYQDPWLIKFDAFYEFWKCSFSHWHVSCGWSDRHEYVIWQWSAPAAQQLLWGEKCTAHFNPFAITCGPE